MHKYIYNTCNSTQQSHRPNYFKKFKRNFYVLSFHACLQPISFSCLLESTLSAHNSLTFLFTSNRYIIKSVRRPQVHNTLTFSNKKLRTYIEDKAPTSQFPIQFPITKSRKIPNSTLYSIT
jgi:hypothetical protein